MPRYPDETADRRRRRVHDGTRLRDVDERNASGEYRKVVEHGDRGAGDLTGRRIERYGEHLAFAEERELSGRDVQRQGSAVDDGGSFTRRQIERLDAPAIGRRDAKEHRPFIGKEERPCVPPFLSRRIERGQRLWSAATLWNTPQRAATREHDGVVARPSRTAQKTGLVGYSRDNAV